MGMTLGHVIVGGNDMVLEQSSNEKEPNQDLIGGPDRAGNGDELGGPDQAGHEDPLGENEI
jgi:hypothetical protein